MMAIRSVSSAKVSGAHLKESQTGAGSSTVTAKILLLTRKVRSWPQLIFSVAWGNDRQSSRTHSAFILESLTGLVRARPRYTPGGCPVNSFGVPHPGCFAERVWIWLIAKGLTFL